MNVPNFMLELRPSTVSSNGTASAGAAVIYTNLLKLDFGEMTASSGMVLAARATNETVCRRKESPEGGHVHVDLGESRDNYCARLSRPVWWARPAAALSQRAARARSGYVRARSPASRRLIEKPP